MNSSRGLKLHDKGLTEGGLRYEIVKDLHTKTGYRFIVRVGDETYPVFQTGVCGVSPSLMDLASHINQYKCWVNMYPYGPGKHIYKTKREANDRALPTRIALASVLLCCFKGDGLDNWVKPVDLYEPRDLYLPWERREEHEKSSTESPSPSGSV